MSAWEWPTGTEVILLDAPENPQENMDLDGHLGAQVANGERPPLVRIWRAGFAHGIGVSRKDVANEAGRLAQETLIQEGHSVVVRQTGGTAVPQGVGVLHVSYLFPRTADSGTTDAYYRALCDPLVGYLSTLGIRGRTGALAGSYCDGNYNILVGNQKLVGTAQAWRGGLAGMKSARPGYILAHACIPVDTDVERAVQVINRYYDLAGDAYRVDPNTATTLRALCPSGFSGCTAAEATDKVVEELRQHYISVLHPVH